MQNQTYSPLPNTGFLRLPEVLKIIPVSPSTIWSWAAQGKFPQPTKLGPRTTAWRVEDLQRWMNEQRDETNCKND